MMKFPLHISSHGVSAPPEKRVCHACHTTTTSQWRYGRTDNVLLCNACGIRWKRKNKASTQEKIKPGPKRSRSQATTVDHSDSSTRSFPSSSSGRPSKTKRSSVEDMVSGSSMQSRYKTDSSDRKHTHHHQRHSSGRNVHRSKMDITQLMSPVEEEYRPRKHTITPRGSPISIQNLLNLPASGGGDDRKSSRRMSNSMGYQPRYN